MAAKCHSAISQKRFKRAAEKSNWNWTDQMLEKTASEMRRYLMKSEHWQYEPPDTFRLLI